MSVLLRNNVRTAGSGERVMMFAHGFGCDQSMWRYVAPEFEADYRVVTCDHVGSGASDLSAYDPQKYATLNGYADDLVQIGAELGVRNGILVGHSVSAMICALASIREPGMFGTLVMVCPSPRYIDDEGYAGGFSAEDVEELLTALAENPMAWSASMAPAIMGNADRPELGQELTDSFCRVDPKVAAQFARATFTADNRADLPKIKARTLILQCREDIIAAEAVGEFVREHITGSKLVMLDATGHCPNLSAPEEVVAAIQNFL